MINREAQAIGERALADAGRAFESVRRDLERLAKIFEPDPMTVSVKLEWRDDKLYAGASHAGGIWRRFVLGGTERWFVHADAIEFDGQYPTEAEARSALLSAVRAALQGDA